MDNSTILFVQDLLCQRAGLLFLVLVHFLDFLLEYQRLLLQRLGCMCGLCEVIRCLCEKNGFRGNHQSDLDHKVLIFILRVVF
jgi:hypothetical protein